MKTKIILLGCLLGVLMFGGADSKVTKRAASQRVPRTLNVTQPLITLKNSFEKVQNSFDLVNIVSLVFEIVIDCVLPILLPSPTTPAPGGPSFTPDLKSHLTQAEVQFIAEKLSHIQNLPNFGIDIEQTDNLCESDAFRNIHNFVWKEDKQQFPDLVNFLYRFGYPKIYDNLIISYEAANCSLDLIKDIENAKPGQEEGKRSHAFKSYSSSSNVREQLLQELKSPSPSQEPQCNIMDIISKIPGTGLLQLASFVETAVYEFNTNPDLHFLIGKLQEPIKGKSVREFHLMPEVQGIMKMMHKKLTESPVWRELFIAIEQLVGIDLLTINIFEFLFSLVEFLLWGTVFPPAAF